MALKMGTLPWQQVIHNALDANAFFFKMLFSNKL